MGAVLEVTAEVAVLAETDFRVEDSGQDQAVLEKVVSQRWLGGAVGQRSSAASQGTRYSESKTVEVENRESALDFRRYDRLLAARPLTLDLYENSDPILTSPQQQSDGTARFRTQTGEFIFRQQSVVVHLR